jgi:hypothetical protein
MQGVEKKRLVFQITNRSKDAVIGSLTVELNDNVRVTLREEMILNGVLVQRHEQLYDEVVEATRALDDSLMIKE